MADSTQQTVPFVSIEGCNKIIYLPAGIKVNYGSSLAQFTNPVIGGYYAITDTGMEGGNITSFYVYTGNGYSKIGENTEEGVILTNDYLFLSLISGQTQKNFNEAISGKLQGLRLETNQVTQELYLKDSAGNTLSTISVAFLNNEGTSFSYNDTNKTLELRNEQGELLASIPVSSFISNVGSTLELSGDQLRLKDKDGLVLSTVTIGIGNVTGLQGSLDGKLVKPTALGDSTVYTQAIIYNPATGMTAYVSTSDILKSIYSADGSLTAARTLNLAGFPLTFAGLPDKSADASFNLVMALNSAGQIAKSNGKQLLVGMPSLLSDTEKTTWKTLMNGGWTTNTMSVALINPIIVRKIDVIQYVTLIGANLNLPPTSFTIDIMDELGSTVITTIPNSQIQLQPDGLSLIFYYNFNDIPIGKYKIRLWNGVAYYTTSIAFQVLTDSGIHYIDKANINWTFNFATKQDGGSFNDYLTSSEIVQIGAIVKKADGSNYYTEGTISSALSSILTADGQPLTMEDNFYIEIETYGNTHASNVLLGISSENSPTLFDNFIASIKFFYGIGYRLLPSNTGVGWATPNNTPAVVTKFIIVKTGNLLTTVLSNAAGSVVSIASLTYSSSPIRLKINKNMFSGDAGQNNTLILVSAYKF